VKHLERLLSWRGHPALALAARLYLGGVFVYAAWHKIVSPADFAVDVATYRMLPLAAINLFALVLPWVEIIAGGMLLVGLRTRAAALLVAGMMAMFIVALAVALARGLDMSCGCFAAQSSADPISGWTMARDGGWLALALYVLLVDRRPLGLDRLLKGGVDATART